MQKSTSADPCLDAALRKLDALQAMHDAFVAEMGRQHADCEAKREAAERERDERTARLTELQRVIDTYAEDGATVVVKAGENGEVDMWSDGHAHAFAPLSSLRAAEARVAELTSETNRLEKERDLARANAVKWRTAAERWIGAARCLAIAHNAAATERDADDAMATVRDAK